MENSRGMLVSVITPTFNSEATIADTIKSVLNQTYDNIEYIIADGASSDATLEIANSFRQQFEQKGYQYIVTSSKDSGVYEGINKGICLSHGILICNVNSDDHLEPNMAEIAVKAYQKSNYDLFYANLNIVNRFGQIVKNKKSKRMRGLITTRHWNHPTMVVPRRVYECRRYDESYKYYADCEMMLWIYHHSNRIAVVNKTLSNFRLGGISTQNSLKESITRAKERYRAYRENGYSRFYLLECIYMDVGKGLAMRWLDRR